MMIFVFALSNKSVCVEMCVYCIITDHFKQNVWNSHVPYSKYVPSQSLSHLYDWCPITIMTLPFLWPPCLLQSLSKLLRSVSGFPEASLSSFLLLLSWVCLRLYFPGVDVLIPCPCPSSAPSFTHPCLTAKPFFSIVPSPTEWLPLLQTWGSYHSHLSYTMQSQGLCGFSMFQWLVAHGSMVCLCCLLSPVTL